MIRILGRHGSNDRYLVGDLRGVGHQFAEMNAGDAGLYAAKRARELALRQRVPAFILTYAAIQPDEADLLLLFLDLLSDGGMEQTAETN